MKDKERLGRRTDKYLRREDTLLARSVHAIFPKEGLTYRTSKRKAVVEMMATIPLAIATAPVTVVFAVAKKIEDGGSSFYREERFGKDGEPIEIIKIRSLEEGAHKDEAANRANVQNIGKIDDPRATRLGRWMRRTKVDEFPQAMQVLAGKLALVEMRADNATTFEEMEESLTSYEYARYEKAYGAANPGLLNPASGFDKGGNRARYHYNMLWARRASMGFALYIVFRNVMRSALATNKK